ncbi:MAG: Tfp pilus assembly PilM family ATPase [Mariniblastus sp.]|jgi:Tfp pilus assembly PilM family ATPase
MALVALQFDENQILVAGARTSGKRLQVQSMFAVDLTGDDSSAAESLKSKLTEHGLSRCDAIIVVSRADVEMRELTIPPAPDNEVPDMVRFMARNEFASLNESWALDYLPLTGGPNEPRNVLAIGISPELQQQQQAIATAAGLKVKHIVLRPFAIVDLIRSLLSDGGCRLLVDPNGDQTDLSIVDGASILTTRTVRIPRTKTADERATALLAEVRRTLASSQKTLGDRQVSQVLVIEDAESNKALEDNLQSQLKLETKFVDPLELASLSSSGKTPSDPHRYGGLLGSLNQENAASPHLIDFLNPRKPIVKQNDYSKAYLWGGVALAASLFAVVACWWVLSSQASAIAVLNTKLNDLKQKNAGENDRPSVDTVLGEIEKIDNWKSSDINWLEELSEVSARSLTPDDTILDSVDAVAGLSKNSNPRMIMAARIGTLEKEETLNDELEDRYVVKSGRWVDTDSDSYPYTSSFTLELKPNRIDRIKEIDQKALEFIKARAKQSQTPAEPQATDVEQKTAAK